MPSVVKLLIIEGMGHIFPVEKVPQILQAILQHTAPYQLYIIAIYGAVGHT